MCNGRGFNGWKDSHVAKIWNKRSTKEILPTIHDTYTISLPVNDKQTLLCVTDTPGLEDFDRLRPQLYDPHLNVAVICFDVTQPGTFQNVLDKWAPEIKYFCPGVPILLVGTKSQLRNDERICETLRRWNSPPPISHAQGIELADDIGAVKYLECDAHAGMGLKNVFHCVITTGLGHSAKKMKARSSLNLLLCWT